MVIGLGGLLTAVVSVADDRLEPFAALAYGVILVGSILGGWS